MYYLLDTQDPTYPCRWIKNTPYVEGFNFRRGIKFTRDVPQPLKYSLYPLDPLARDHGPEMPAFFNKSIPLFRDDFRQAFLDFGVHNFDAYAVEIYDPDNNEIHTNYKAINIIGLVSAADFGKSNATIHDGIPLLDVDFDGLYIDEDKAQGHMFFRLAESTNAILVHENLKNYLVENGFDHVCFNDPALSAV